MWYQLLPSFWRYYLTSTFNLWTPTTNALNNASKLICTLKEKSIWKKLELTGQVKTQKLKNLKSVQHLGRVLDISKFWKIKQYI